MKLGIIGDLHFGFHFGGEREWDSFTQGKEAFDKVIAEDVDAMILLGDIFDSPIPRPEVWSRAAEILTLPLLAKKSEVRLAGLINKTRESVKERLCFSGIPVIAIHGTHERRPRGQSNPVETLEKLGLLVYLHGNGIILDKGTERVAVQGIGGVPEKYAQQVFRSWNPKPIPNSTNLLIFHQSVKPFIYTGSEPALEVSDLPQGFDLYIDGHLHRSLLQKNLLFTGSTMITQMKKDETEGKKVWILTQERGNIKLRDLALQTPRKLFYIEVDANGGTPEEVLEKCRAALAAVPKTEQSKPLVRLKLTGKLRSGFLASDLDLYRLVAEYRNSAIISPDRSELVGEAPQTTMMNLEDVRDKNRVSFEELTVELLRGALQKSGFPTESVDLESLYSLLYEGDVDAAGEIIVKGRSGGGKS